MEDLSYSSPPELIIYITHCIPFMVAGFSATCPGCCGAKAGTPWTVCHRTHRAGAIAITNHQNSCPPTHSSSKQVHHDQMEESKPTACWEAKVIHKCARFCVLVFILSLFHDFDAVCSTRASLRFK